MKRFEIKNKYLHELLGEAKAEKEVEITEEDQKLSASALGRKAMDILNEQVELKRTVRLYDHLELDLGLTSLDRVNLVLALEQALAVNIPDTTMARIFTVKELILALQEIENTPGVQKRPAVTEAADPWPELLKQGPSAGFLKNIELKPNWAERFLTWLVGGNLWLLFKIFWRLKVRGIKNIPRQGPFALCSNHGSYLDGFLIAAALPRLLKKDLFFIAAKEYFEAPLIKKMIKLIRIIPADPAALLVDAMQACAYLLRKGKIVCIFPEGEGTIDGEVKEFRRGVGILAREVKVPLVPVYLKGSYESWPRPARFPRPKPIEVIFGKPCTVEELKEIGLSKGAKDTVQAISAGLREKVLELQNGAKT